MKTGLGRLPKIAAVKVGISLSMAMLLALANAGCMSEAEKEQLTGVLTPPNTGSGEVPLPTVPTGCAYERFSQPEAQATNKLDILFISDTSGSFHEERGRVAEAIVNFVAALPAETDYRVAVMLAHGSLSAYSGKLYSTPNTHHHHGEPLVLDSQLMDLVNLQQNLKYKIMHVATDSHSDGGEEGLFSLMRGLETANLSESQNAGFFRADAALATIFVADENDICADFPEGVVPVPDPEHGETTAKARDCGGINPDTVVARLREVKGDLPLLVGGVIYNNLATVPHHGENEYGYGYAETILHGNGLSIDLADGDYQVGMTSLGQLTTLKMNLLTEFTIHPSAPVDPASVQALVDAQPVPFHFEPSSLDVQLTAELGGPNSKIDVVYCPLEMPNDKVADICEDGAFVAKPNPILGVSLDPAEGSQAIIMNGLTAMGYAPILYNDSQIASGQPIADGVDVLVIARKVILSAVNQSYIDGVLNYLSQSGGSLITEFDGTALLFSDFSGNNPIINKLTPSLELFTGLGQGGGALLPTPASTTYITDGTHPITQGLPASFNLGLRSAFAISNYDGEWLDTPANFVSLGTLNQVPAGTFPAIMAGRCGAGRVAGFTMTHFTVIQQEPVKTMVRNAIHWVTGT